MFDKNEKMTMNEIQRRFPRVYKDNIMLDNLSKLSIQYNYYKTMIQAFMGQYQPKDYQAEYQAYVKDFDEYEYGEIKLGNQLAAFSIVWDGVDSEQYQKLEHSLVHQIATAKICTFAEGWDMYYTAANVICLASAETYVNIDATQGLTRGIGSYLEAAGVESLEVSAVSHCSPGWKNFWGQNGRLDVGQVITADDECYFISDYTPPDGMMIRLECNSQNAAGTSGYYWYVRSSDKLALPWVYRYCNGDWFNKNGISSYPFEITTRLEVGKVYDVGRRVSVFSTGSMFAPLFRSATAAQVMTYEEFVEEKQRQAKYELYVMTYQPLPVTRKPEVGDIVQDLHIATDGVYVDDTGAIDFARVCDFVDGTHMDKAINEEYPGRGNGYTIGTETIAAL